jgi:Fe-S cluster biogenesis protein NfuA
MLIRTEFTPNPDALKFLPNLDIAKDSPVHFGTREEASNKSGLAFELFGIEGVRAVFLGSDFITITKNSDLSWQILKPQILLTITDYLESALPVFYNVQSKEKDKVDSLLLSEIEKQIIDIIETRVRPSVAMDGGDIIYRGFENGIVKLELYGSCAGCPSSSITLKNGIESMLKHFIPEVISVEQA